MTSQYSVVVNTNASSPIRTGYTFVQGDKGISFQIIVNELDFASTSAKIVFHRANGTSVESAATYAGNVVSYTTLGNEFAVPGIVVADVKFYDGDTQRVSTASFIFNVNEDTLDGLGGGTAGYSDELEVLREQLEEESALFSQTLQEYIDAFGAVGAIHPAGDWNNATAYHVLDLVWHNGASWIAKLANTNQTPQAGSVYWQQFTDYGSEVMGAISAITNVYGAKNFANVSATTTTVNGLTFTVNADKSIKVTYGDGTSAGSPSANTSFEINKPAEINLTDKPCILTGCPSGGSYTTWLLAYSNWVDAAYEDFGNGITVIPFSKQTYPNQRMYIRIAQTATIPVGGITFYPMIRDSRIPDATYVPFCYTNRQLLSFKDNGVLGCKNFAYHNQQTTSANNVTRTVNADKSITLSGTASAQGGMMTKVFPFHVPADGVYTFTIGTSALTGYIETTGFVRKLTTVNGEVTGFLSASDELLWNVWIPSGTNTTGITIKGLLTLATDTDPTYQPFSKTNQQLTTDKAERTDLSDIIINGTTNNTGSTITTGTYFYLNGQLCRCLTNVANGATFTLNTNYETTTVGESLSDCSIVSSTTITTYATGVEPLNPGEEIKCIKYSNGTIILTGLLKTTAEVAADTELFVVPEGYRKQVLSVNYWMPICLNNNTLILGRYLNIGLRNWSAAIPSGVWIPIYIVL